MNEIKSFYHRVFIFLTIGLLSCNEKESQRLSIHGNIKNLGTLKSLYPAIGSSGSLMLVLYEIPFGGDAQPIALDSTKIVTGANSASFTLEANAPHQGMYDIVVSEGPVIPLINDSRDLEVEIDFGQKDPYYLVKGSAASAALREFIVTYNDNNSAMDNAMQSLNSLKQVGSSDTLLIAATAEKNRTLENVNRYVKETLARTTNPTVAAFVLGRGAKTFIQKDFEAELSNTVRRFPEDENLNSIQKTYLSYKTQAADMENKRRAQSWVGKQAPDLTMPDESGKKISLKDFRGRYVLVDFWASWCGPCRQENPSVVKAYNTFRNKNFTVLGVSLDKEKNNWLQAIREDHLTWTHISDLAYWNSEAVSIFKFEGIPYNVLIDPKGTIIGEALRGDDLVNKLQEVLGGKSN